MPEIDLPPDEYRRREDGRWRHRDNPRFAMGMFLVATAVLAYIWLRRDELGARPDLLFGVTAMFAFGAGAQFAIWLKDRR